jgi:hypothetical protein
VYTKIRDKVKTHEAAIRKPVLDKGRFTALNPQFPARIIVRYIVAYHFFARAAFEEIADKVLVSRVQMHLAALKLVMQDEEVANMLQYAAEGVWSLHLSFRSISVQCCLTSMFDPRFLSSKP